MILKLTISNYYLRISVHNCRCYVASLSAVATQKSWETVT